MTDYTDTTGTGQLHPPIMVLLIDDQPMVGELIRRLLETEHDIALHYCSSQETALDHAAEVRPTVILQDLVMPGIDGLEMVRRFRARPATAHTPIVVLSSKEEAVVKSEALPPARMIISLSCRTASNSSPAFATIQMRTSLTSSAMPQCAHCAKASSFCCRRTQPSA